MTRGPVLACTILCLPLGRPAKADEPPFPAIGSRVRLSTPARASIDGILTAFDHETLTLRITANQPAREVARRDITTIEYQTRKSQKSKAALIGLAAGFAIGFAGTALVGNCDESGGVARCVDPFWGSVYGAAFGLVGASVGALVAPGARWERVSLPLAQLAPRRGDASPTLGLVPFPGGRPGVALALSF